MKYKEKTPRLTIDAIKKHLGSNYNIDLVLRPSNLKQFAPSYTLTCKELALITNGKGETPIFSQASAYGEFFERLYNMAYLRFGNITAEDLEIKYPNCIYVDRSDIDNHIHSFISKEAGVNSNKNKMIKHLLYNLIDAYYGKKMIKIPCIPFKNYADEELLIPIAIADHLFGTNGMAAGNTFEEAFIQGYSEIMERQAVKDLNAGKIIPNLVEERELSDNYIAGFLSNISKIGDFKIKMVTFEKTYNFPVAALLIIDKKRKLYKVKFGAHCTLRYAMQRCITEMLQGASIDDYSKWIPIEAACFSESGENMKIFENGSGTLSRKGIEALLSTKKYYSTKWAPDTNMDAYNDILKSSIHSEIYVWISKMQPICAMQIYIPEMTRIVWHTDEEVENIIRNYNIARSMKNFIEASKNNGKELGKFLKLVECYPDDETLDKFAMFMCPIQKQFLKLFKISDLKLLYYVLRRDKKFIYDYYKQRAGVRDASDEDVYMCISAAYLLGSGRVPNEMKEFFSKETIEKMNKQLSNGLINVKDISYCRKCPKYGQSDCIKVFKRKVCVEMNNEGN